MPELKNHLIICGCPRSGTSAIVNLLNSHHSMIIGMERYKFYFRKTTISKFKPACFTQENFFSFSEDQTNVIPGEKHPDLINYYDTLEQKFAEQKEVIIGDKVPLAFRFYDEIETNFKNAKFIFMLRNIKEVAISYVARQNNKKDSWGLGYEQAVEHWNESLTKTWEYLQKRNDNIFVCEYEKIYSYKPEYLQSLTDFLDIDLSSDLESKYLKMTQGWQERRSKQKVFDEKYGQYVVDNGDFETMNKLTSFKIPVDS